MTEWYWWVGTCVVAVIGFSLGLLRDGRKERITDMHNLENKVTNINTRVSVLEQTSVDDNKVRSIVDTHIIRIDARLESFEGNMKSIKEGLTGIQIAIAELGHRQRHDDV